MISTITIMSLFAGGIVLNVGFDLRPSYIFVLFSLGAILLFTERPILPIIPLTVILVWIIFSFIVTLAIDPHLVFTATLPQIIGIGFFASFFLIFFANSRTDPVSVFEKYVQASILVALLGLPILLWTGITEEFWRLQSVFAEPAHYATALMPATAYALSTVRTAPIRAMILVGAMLLTLSLTGYIGLGLTLAFLVGRKWWSRLFLIIVGGGLLFVAYMSSPEIRMRIDDTARVATSANFAGANLSTYALLSNVWVAGSAVSNEPLFGGGLGSHPHNHDRYIGKLEGLGVLEDYIDQNKYDANSLLVRTVSEQGIVGVIIIAFFLFSYRKANSVQQQDINNAIFIYFLLKLVRDGHYFTPEFFFMVVVYYYNGGGALRRQHL